MELRQRGHEADTAGGGQGPAGLGGAGFEALRRAAESYAAAGEEAINKVLSKGKSEAFLASIRQQGGE